MRWALIAPGMRRLQHKKAVGAFRPLERGITHGKSCFFELQTATDLLCKLERECARLEQDPEDGDHGHNFVATAENMPE
jgi:hypothetical protein